MFQLRKIILRLLFILPVLFKPKQYWNRYLKFKGKAIVVYSAGKVGSSTIYYSLMKYFVLKKIYHNHFLSVLWMTRLSDTVFKRDSKMGQKTVNVLAGYKTSEQFLIVPYRDPIARDLSNIAQNWDKLELEFAEASLGEIISFLNQNGHDFMEEWFKTEFCEFTKMSFSDIKVDLSKGYAIFNDPLGRNICLINSQRISKELPLILKDFMGIVDFKVFGFNDSEKKARGEVYTKLKNNYTRDKDFLVEFYERAFIKRLFSETERDRFITRWKGPEV